MLQHVFLKGILTLFHFFTDCCIWDVSFRSLWQESKYSAKHTGKKKQDESKNSFVHILRVTKTLDYLVVSMDW